MRKIPHTIRVKGRYYFRGPRDPVTGKRCTVPLGDNYTIAASRVAELLAGDGEDAGSVSAALSRYVARELPKRANKTREEQLRQAERLRGVFGRMRLGAVQPQHVARYLAEHPAPVAANREIALLSAVYTKAVVQGYCDRNPCNGVPRNPEQRRERYLTRSELAALRNAADKQWACIIELALLTAARRGDLMRVRWTDVSDEGLYLRQGKTGHRQLFTWSPALKALIARIKKLNNRKVASVTFFAKRSGAPMTETGWNSAWRRLVARSGVTDVHFHDIRGTVLTDARNRYGLDYAQALAGHERRDTTEGYTQSRMTHRVAPMNGD